LLVPHVEDPSEAILGRLVEPPIDVHFFHRVEAANDATRPFAPPALCACIACVHREKV
jgi:hypothetical protein